MFTELDVITSLVKELRATNSLIKKEEVLNKYWQREDFRPILEKLFHAVYDYDRQYYITSANILKFKKKASYQAQVINNPWCFADSVTLWGLLDELSERIITGNLALTVVNEFLRVRQFNDEQQAIIFNIIDKDLKCGLSEVTINKVYGNIIPQFKVALAQKLDKEVLDKTYVCSRKLDGCRCITIIKNQFDIKFFSRQGKEFDTLNTLKKDIENLVEIGVISDNTVLDGEICITDEKGKEDFQSVMKEIKRKDHTIQNPMYIMFDLLTLDEFNKGTSNKGYRERLNYLQTIYNDLSLINNKHLRVVEHFDYTPEEFKKWQQKVIDNGWEGLIARKNVPYENKRSKNMLKIKSFQDEEFKVIGVEEGDAQELINGVMHKIKCVGSLIVEYKGNKVNVGTGLSLEQRKRWYKHPEEIIGSTITVKFFEPTQNQDGSWSLRFPVLKAVYKGERDL